MAIDYAAIAAAGGLGKGLPRVVAKAKKDKAEGEAWDTVKEAVDLRDKCVCFVTGEYLTTKTADKWRFLDRAHLEARSLNKKRRYLDENVLTLSRGVHQLFDAGALRILDKRGNDAHRVQDIDHVAWNRLLVPKGDEPCSVRRGLPVRKG